MWCCGFFFFFFSFRCPLLSSYAATKFPLNCLICNRMDVSSDRWGPASSLLADEKRRATYCRLCSHCCSPVTARVMIFFFFLCKAPVLLSLPPPSPLPPPLSLSISLLFFCFSFFFFVFFFSLSQCSILCSCLNVFLLTGHKHQRRIKKEK